ncbi:unnamed protein product [Caenorhabditis bovis]|uniref:Uncharacterized protein n=1 Tax=Caenorhabditis bovis TaxID=2654633 RepID=A0A8S1E7M3_9PELO|nr:unnamed protein product [Caenorhabditis bovis]
MSVNKKPNDVLQNVENQKKIDEVNNNNDKSHSSSSVPSSNSSIPWGSSVPVTSPLFIQIPADQGSFLTDNPPNHPNNAHNSQNAAPPIDFSNQETPSSQNGLLMISSIARLQKLNLDNSDTCRSEFRRE